MHSYCFFGLLSSHRSGQELIVVGLGVMGLVVVGVEEGRVLDLCGVAFVGHDALAVGHLIVTVPIDDVLNVNLFIVGHLYSGYR